MENKNHSRQESFKVSNDELLSKVKEIIKEVNARKIIIRNKKVENRMMMPGTIETSRGDPVPDAIALIQSYILYPSQ